MQQIKRLFHNNYNLRGFIQVLRLNQLGAVFIQSDFHSAMLSWKKSDYHM